MIPVRATAQNMISASPGTAGGHVAWFDYAKGICIILVVMMHSTLGVGEAFSENGLGDFGFMHHVVAYAKPFRMPDFFLLSGLFLSLAIGRSWSHYLDKKLVHFIYFYAIWTVIQATIKTAATSGLDASGLIGQFMTALVTPFPTLWFIYILPVFFIATKLLRGVPGWALLAGAAALQILPVHTGWATLDHFIAPYYFFFLAGYLLAPHVFTVANWARNNVAIACLGIAVWAVLNGILTHTSSPFARWEVVSDLPVLSLLLGGLGAIAIVATASLLSKFNVASAIRYCGRNSIVIYISFAIPMAITRVILLKTGVITDVGIASALVWLAALISPLVVHAILRHTPLRWLYERPSWFALSYDRALDEGVKLNDGANDADGNAAGATLAQAR